MKKKIVILGILIISILLCSNLNVYGAAYTLPIEYGSYSYSSEYDKYIGLYYTTKFVGGNPSYKFENQELYNNIFNLDVTVKKSELEEWFGTSIRTSGGVVIYNKYSITELEDMFQKSSSYKMNSTSEINAKGNSSLILEKGTLKITDEYGKTLATLPHYIICKREDTYVNAQIGTVKKFTPKEYSSEDDIKGDLETIITTYNNFQTNTNIVNTPGVSGSTSGSDFWGDASSWFGQAQSSGYQTPTEVNNIIEVFENMINVVGTTVIIIATIVLGIKYIIGTVESKVSAKEGLITLLVACIFFFGWTSIKNLLFPGNNFIFTSETDVSYTSMVGRIFSTFTYIAQFIVVGAIIFVGIKYIFAGADGRAELKGKSVYFIIGIILVFATTNVLSFISKIIDETI